MDEHNRHGVYATTGSLKFFIMYANFYHLKNYLKLLYDFHIIPLLCYFSL